MKIKGSSYSAYEKFQYSCIKEAELLTKEENASIIARALLDSSLISATNLQKYDVKIIKCGDYLQVYKYQNTKIKKDNDLEELEETEKLKKEKKKKESEYLSVEEKNIKRSRLEMQRLIKSNIDKFHTFITLTFAENITDIAEANKKFHNFINQVQRKLKKQNKEFYYVAVPEFQKRGAVHYHMLTSLTIENDTDIILKQQDSKYDNQYDVKYWSHGFTSVFDISSINIIGYLTKYMTKDIDNRLFYKRRYLYSLNLEKPTISYLCTDNIVDFKRYIEFFNNDIEYSANYYDMYDNIVDFNEFLIKKESEG